ncbi:MAG: patatin-like phospholipase family protein [Terracidiphilus sp.]|jgi:NTE family protein
MPWNRTAILIAFVLLATAASGQEPAPQPAPQQSPQPAALPAPPPSPLPAVVPPNRPAIGLALEGGGALGLAHVGVIQWLEEHHIPIDRVAGTSMGALVGAAYSTGQTPAQMRALAVSDAFMAVFTLQTPYVDSSFRRRQDRRQNPAAITVGLRHGPALRNALLSSRGVDEFLSTTLLAYNRQQLDYNRFPIPFRCVATDLNSLQAVTFAAGPLAQAVRASISIPGVFPPVQNSNGHYLVDGGILDNLPTDVLRHGLRADTVIAVRFEDAPLANADVSSIVGVLNRAFTAGIVQNVDRAVRLADVVVTVPVANFSASDYTKGSQLIQAGYLAAEANRTVLLPYALDDQDWNAYLAARDLRRLAQPGILRQVRVEGGEPGARQQVRSDMKPLEGQPISPAKTLDALKPIQSNGDLSATYQTFGPPPAAAATTASNPDAGGPGAASPDTGILVHLTPDPTGPPFLLVGPDLAAETSNITRMELDLRLVDQNLGGFGSELRANAQLGYMTGLNAEYYRLLTPNGFFLEPRTGILREPVYIWAGQKRVAERLQQNLDAGLEAGRTFSNSLQISTEWRAEDTHWSLTTGSGGGPYLNGTAQTGLLHIDIDKEASGSVSPKGFRLSAFAGALYHAVASDNAPLAMLSAARTWQWRDRNIFGLTADINSYLRTNVAEPYRFTLGGPRRLSASSFDEYRGTDTYLARAGYLRRLAALPTGLGQGLYGVIGYEAGEIWSPQARAILRQDGTASLVAATPLGSVSLGASVGDAGHRKVFFTIGRLF